MLTDGIRAASDAFEAGEHEVAWDGRAADGRASASGVYFGRLLLDGQVTGPTLKMSVVK